MARPLIGDAKRDVVASVRITKEEEQQLVGTFGGRPANGLRILLDAWKASHDTAS